MKIPRIVSVLIAALAVFAIGASRANAAIQYTSNAFTLGTAATATITGTSAMDMSDANDVINGLNVPYQILNSSSVIVWSGEVTVASNGKPTGSTGMSYVTNSGGSGVGAWSWSFTVSTSLAAGTYQFQFVKPTYPYGGAGSDVGAVFVTTSLSGISGAIWGSTPSALPPTVTWGSVPPSTVYPGTTLSWSANAADSNGTTLGPGGVQLHFDLSTNGGAFAPEAYNYANNPNANSFAAGAAGTTYQMRATVSDPTYNGGAFVGGIFNSVTVVAIPTSFSFSPTSFTYNGGAQGPGISPSVGGASYSVGGTSSAVNVGSYSVTATATGNYSGSGGPVGWTISAAPTSFSVSPTSITYTGGAVGPTITPNPAGATYSSGGTPSAVAVGSYAVSATANGNYTGSSGSVGWSIVPAGTSFTVSPTSFTYNGGAQGPSITPSPAGATYSVSGTPSATAAGSYSLTVTANGNYTGSSGAKSWTINPAAATVSLSNLTQTYTGSAEPVTVGTTPASLPVSVTYNGSTTAPTNVGTYTVVATVTNPNYSGSTSGTLTINPASASFTISPTSFTYNGVAQGPTVTVSPVGATYSVTGTASATGAASYSVTATATGNYTGTNTAPWSIAKASATVTLSNLVHTYNGTPQGATVTTVPASLATSVTYNGSTPPPTNAGSYATVATITDPNYTGSTSGTLTINPQAASFTVSPLMFTFNGTAQGPTITATPAGATFSTTGTTLATSTGSYSLTATATGNYTGTSGVKGWSINPAAAPAEAITWHP